MLDSLLLTHNTQRERALSRNVNYTKLLIYEKIPRTKEVQLAHAQRASEKEAGEASSFFTMTFSGSRKF
jgi:hypothetical protein